MDSSEDQNQTSLPSEFILMGLTNHPHITIVLFVAFTIIYTVAMIGNLLIVVLVRADSRLHTPMYFFLSNFSILEVCYTSTVVPQMLSHILSERKNIPLVHCAMQLCLFLSFGITETFLLTVMSYDRYVAICLPLHYSFIITKQACIAMAAASWAGGFFFSAINTAITLQLSFGGHNKIDHFLCEMPAMMRAAYAGIQRAKLCMLISCVFTLILPFLLILVSYARILYTIFDSHSNAGRRKAISTCSSHLAVVTLFFGAVFSMYLRPKSSSSRVNTKMSSVFYIVITPALNPIIYSLRNKDVLQALKKVMNLSKQIN
ncbi:olfactory receptor 2D2-like [Eublepharis macularius]|uniref:Olfactory receptor n=1 Tax=Eublepharis macularius TaxID=481883 RepID=A0AA97K1M5_EUBMA|nr:olfactory receptor 2D2-like [Eublepharis macularius]